MLKHFLHKNALILAIIAFPSLMGTLLVLLRVSLTGYHTFAFMLWNLFLAWIPLMFSMMAEHEYNVSHRISVSLIVLSLIWLLFYPNAPYILTDLIHLKANTHVPVWFDLALILSFAWTGLFIGYISLFIMQKIVTTLTSKLYGWLFVIVITGLSSFGVYVGRFLRFNSWDVISNPKDLLIEAAAPLVSPLSNKWDILFTGVFFVISVYIYLTFYFSAKISRQNTVH